MTRKGPRPKPIAERFWPKVAIMPNGCWEWTGALNKDGYGKFGMPGAPGGWVLAHRVAWELQVGPIPRGLSVLHRCDNRKCQRKEHHFLGTQSVNQRDMVQKGRAVSRVGEQHGRARLTEEAVREIRRSHLSDDALAAKFNVSTGAIWRVRHFETWCHVSD